MRTIKFRGKRLDNGQWVYGDLISFQGECWINKNGVEKISDTMVVFNAIAVDPETVGQLIIPSDYEHNMTGLDFYEGDLVEEYGVIRVLAFEFCDDTQGFDVNLDFWSAEIIGNIHDNPELLNTEQNA